METSATSPSNAVAMMTQQAEEQWRRAGGHVLPPFAPIACASRRAFALLQAAAALDQECARLRQELCELNTGEDATRRVRACVSPTSKAGATAQQEMDDESDGSDLQGSLVAANVRPGKPLVLLSARDGLEHRAPDGSLRLVAADMLSEHEREQLLAGGLVAMAGAFSRCGQTTLGISPALAARVLATTASVSAASGADGTAGAAAALSSTAMAGVDLSGTVPLLYRVVERARRRVAAAFGADLATLRVSDATFTRLQPVSTPGAGGARTRKPGSAARSSSTSSAGHHGNDGSAGDDGRGACTCSEHDDVVDEDELLHEATAAGALDVGLLRHDQFCYWRAHIDQVSASDDL